MNSKNSSQYSERGKVQDYKEQDCREKNESKNKSQNKTTDRSENNSQNRSR